MHGQRHSPANRVARLVAIIMIETIYIFRPSWAGKEGGGRRGGKRGRSKLRDEGAK